MKTSAAAPTASVSGQPAAGSVPTAAVPSTPTGSSVACEEESGGADKEAKARATEVDLSAIIGRTGRFHRAMLAYEMLAMLTLAMHNTAHSAGVSDLDYWCRLPDRPENMSLEEWKAANIPRDPDGTLSRCLVYTRLALVPPAENETRMTAPCEAKVFNVSNYAGLSVVKEWDLTCSREWMLSASETIYLLGSFMGLLVSGLSADKIGRRPTICLSSVVLWISGVSVVTADHFAFFVVLRFIVSASISAISYTTYVLLVEIVALQWRALYGTSSLYGFFAGVLANAFIIGKDRLWRTRQMFAMLPSTLLLIAFFILPESPRWLLLNLRIAEASRVVSNILRTNRVDEETIKSVLKRLRNEPLRMLHGRISTTEIAEQYRGRRKMQAKSLDKPDKSLWELLTIFTTQYQLSDLSLGFCWFACSITYYGIALDVGQKTKVVIIVGAFVTPAIAYFLICSLGRRSMLTVSLLFTSLSCLFIALVQEELTAQRFVAVAEGTAWFFINVAYTVLFVYATEIYPTLIRGLGFNLGAAFGRIGTITASFLFDSSAIRQSKMVPYLILCVSCAVASLLVSRLSETKETPLPELVKPEPNIFEFSPMNIPGGRSKKPVADTLGPEAAIDSAAAWSRPITTDEGAHTETTETKTHKGSRLTKAQAKLYPTRDDRTLLQDNGLSSAPIQSIMSSGAYASASIERVKGIPKSQEKVHVAPVDSPQGTGPVQYQAPEHQQGLPRETMLQETHDQPCFTRTSDASRPTSDVQHLPGLNSGIPPEHNQHPEWPPLTPSEEHFKPLKSEELSLSPLFSESMCSVPQNNLPATSNFTSAQGSPSTLGNQLPTADVHAPSVALSKVGLASNNATVSAASSPVASRLSRRKKCRRRERDMAKRRAQNAAPCQQRAELLAPTPDKKCPSPTLPAGVTSPEPEGQRSSAGGASGPSNIPAKVDASAISSHPQQDVQNPASLNDLEKLPESPLMTVTKSGSPPQIENAGLSPDV